MSTPDISAAAALCTLMDAQAKRLESLAARVTLASTSLSELPDVTWQGAARLAHDLLFSRFRSNLALARHSLGEAASESARAANTLAHYVG